MKSEEIVMKLTKIALGCAMAIGATAAQAADTLLFPYVVSGGAVTTVVSVINTQGAASVGTDVGEYYTSSGGAWGTYSGTNKYLHWRYHIKTANTPGADCIENNGYFPTSPLDIVSYDVSGQRGIVVNDVPTGVMFSDPSSNNNWKAVPAVNQWSAITLSGQRAVLFVHNAGSSGENFLLRGEAIIVEFDTGAAWGYSAVRQGTVGSSSDFDFDYSFVGPINAESGTVSLMPMQEITTRFFITPVNDPAVPDDPATPGTDESLASTLSILTANGLDTTWFGKLTTRIDLVPISGSIRVINRDEGGISGGVTPQDVTCVFPVDASQLITASNILNYTKPQGGWVQVGSSRPSGATWPTENAIAIKLEFRSAGSGGDFDMPESVGAFNNAYVMNPGYRN